jgi:hypothetical protein
LDAATLVAAVASVGTLLVGIAAVITSLRLKKIANDVLRIEIATNSMKDALVAATKIAGEAEGRRSLLAEQKAEGGS